jgi:hypothetical protein
MYRNIQTSFLVTWKWEVYFYFFFREREETNNKYNVYSYDYIVCATVLHFLIKNICIFLSKADNNVSNILCIIITHTIYIKICQL